MKRGSKAKLYREWEERGELQLLFYPIQKQAEI
jgi:hypothetical protein